MVFYPPSWIPKLPFEPPDSITIEEFMTDENFGRPPLSSARSPFTCGITGQQYQATAVVNRVELLSRALAKELDWSPSHGTEWEKVMGIFTLNTIDFLTLSWAVHRLGGLCTPANPTYTAAELAHQLKDSAAQALFTCTALLDVAVKAAKQVGIAEEKIFVFEIAVPSESAARDRHHESLDDLIDAGSNLPKLVRLQLQDGEGARKTAFLCYSSGTSGLPKGVMVSHRNIIANVLQIKTVEYAHRQSFQSSSITSDYTQVVLDVLPQGHIYGLVFICHTAFFRGDQVIVLPKYNLLEMLQAIQKFTINTLFLVPPIIISMVKERRLLSNFNMMSVHSIVTGAAPLGAETAEQLHAQSPSWLVRQGYGLTESSTVVTSSLPHDMWFGSSGCLIPGFAARLVTPTGEDIDEYDRAGELLLRSPSIVLGYYKNEKANKETFDGPWLRTGDEAMFCKRKTGNEHLWIIDRIKELIKVKGNQVAPAELEDHLLAHADVADCAVIGVPDDQAGECPKAFVVKSLRAATSNAQLEKELRKHVQQGKARYKWLTGGIEFVDTIPKSASGKILRRELRDRERVAKQRPSKL